MKAKLTIESGIYKQLTLTPEDDFEKDVMQLFETDHGFDVKLRANKESNVSYGSYDRKIVSIDLGLNTNEKKVPDYKTILSQALNLVDRMRPLVKKNTKKDVLKDFDIATHELKKHL